MIEKVKKVLAEVFDISDVPDDLQMDDIEEWNSLGQINLILAIEAEFNIKIPTEKILHLSSVNKIAAYLEHTNNEQDV